MGLVLMGRAMLSKPLNQFSVDGLGCVPSLLFDLRPNYQFSSVQLSPATQCSVVSNSLRPHRLIAWRIPGTAEPGGLPSMGLHRVGDD